ncbi:MAG: glycosyltransferase family 2 protein [Nibricoccus sp.]
MNPSGRVQNFSTRDIGVVVVTYRPAGDYCARLSKMASQGATMVIVDNGSAEPERTCLEEHSRRHQWTFISNATNRGVGAALNQGVDVLAKFGLAWALLFDQDSEPSASLSETMMETLRRHSSPSKVAVIGTSFYDTATGGRHRILRSHPRCHLWFQKVKVASDDLESVTMVITSASLVSVRDYEKVGRFDETLFIDYVDTDFCLRCRATGQLIAVSAAARIEHTLGARTKKRWMGFSIRPTNHSAVRHYYIARNRMLMWRRHRLTPFHWWVFDLLTSALWLARVVFAEPSKWAKVRAMVLGTRDGVCGRIGPCPEAVRLSIEK